VKDNELTVAKYLQKVGKDNGTAIVIKKYFRFETGECMQHREENFAEEVAKQMNK
jgi:elongation factor Ts